MDAEAEAECELQDEDIRRYGMKIKLFILSCGKWSMDKIGEQIASKFANKLDYKIERSQTVYETIKHSKFLNYATVVFIFNGYCKCRIRVLLDILQCVSRNIYLRYKSKLFILNYNTGCCGKRSQLFDPPLDVDIVPHIGSYDNIIVYQNNMANERDTSVCYLLMLSLDRAKPHQSLQEFFKTMNRPSKHAVVRASTTAELYIYTINPALAIIINNYYFTSQRDVRKGSERDVVQLMRELKIAHIPYILIEDCNHRQLMRILEYIEHKDFRPLKSFLFFLMTHGDSNGIVYTDDGQLNFHQDVVQRIQANKSLDEAQKLLVSNTCRGPYDFEDSVREEIPPLCPTDGGYLKNNTMVLYSVPENIRSPRCLRTGSPFIQRFCHHFRQIDHTVDIRQVDERISEDLLETDYFFGYDKSCELVLRNPNEPHAIRQVPTNAVDMLKLIQSILEDFPLLNEHEDNGRNEREVKSLFHICGTLNETRVPKISIVETYFSPELDKD